MIFGPLLGNRRRTGLFLSICTFSFVLNYGRIAFAPLVDHFILLGATPALAGLTATAVWLGSALPRLPTGYLLTRIGRHHVIIGMGAWLVVAAAFTAFSPDMRFTVIGALAIGLSTGAFFIAANPLVSELFPANVGLALGVRGMFSQFAAVAAPAIVALTILLGSWRIGFAALAVIALVLTVVFGYHARRAELPSAGETDRDLLDGIRSEWSLVAAGIAFVGLAGFVWQGVFNFYVTYLGAEQGISPRVAGTLLTVMFAAGIPSWIVGGRLADRFPFRGMLLVVLGGFAGSLYLLTVAEGLVAIAIVSVILGFVIHTLFPIGDAYLLATLPDDHRASAYSGFSASMMLMQAPGSVVVGLLAQSGLQYVTIFRAFAVGIAVITLVLALLASTGRLPSGGSTPG